MVQCLVEVVDLDYGFGLECLGWALMFGSDKDVSFRSRMGKLLSWPQALTILWSHLPHTSIHPDSNCLKMTLVTTQAYMSVFLATKLSAVQTFNLPSAP